MELSTDLSHLTGIGPNFGRRLERLELFTVESLINHFPFRYDDFSEISTGLDAQINQKAYESREGFLQKMKRRFSLWKEAKH